MKKKIEVRQPRYSPEKAWEEAVATFLLMDVDWKDFEIWPCSTRFEVPGKRESGVYIWIFEVRFRQ